MTDGLAKDPRAIYQFMLKIQTRVYVSPEQSLARPMSAQCLDNRRTCLPVDKGVGDRLHKRKFKNNKKRDFKKQVATQ